MRTHLPPWQALCQKAHLQDPDGRIHAQLRDAYVGRAYHSIQHIGACLAWLDAVAESGVAIPEAYAVELALWFHDIVYDSRAADNEEQSAEIARSALLAMGGPVELTERVASLILATKHHHCANDPAAAWVVDIDLAILGESPARFETYDEQIRQEYEWVPMKVYREKRAEVLRTFLNRQSIYKTEFFRRRLEDQARVNLAAAIRRLK
ncbi:MAG: hypothetical protein H7A55_14180 [Verrucomicrobiaceae bacterium]|nr:hypothetical protein [Verrucomicrobiaceae bacterium]